MPKPIFNLENSPRHDRLVWILCSRINIEARWDKSPTKAMQKTLALSQKHQRTRSQQTLPSNLKIFILHLFVLEKASRNTLRWRTDYDSKHVIQDQPTISKNSCHPAHRHPFCRGGT